MRRYRIEEKEFNEINITPFTDVVLVLLLIFMISSPFLVSGALKVKLPEAVNSEQNTEGSIEVYLSDKNDIYLNNKKMSMDDFKINIQYELMKRANKEVIIKADRNSLHGSFVQMLDILKSSGATKFLIATAKKE
ncbi:MAG: ExbD/TolR family protein [Bacteroidota bacterium]